MYDASPSLTEALELLESHELICILPRGDVRFIAEATYQRALYASPPEERARGHVAVAEWLKENQGPAVAIAQHFRAAGKPAAAAPHLLAAARASLMAGTPVAADALLFEAESILENDADRAVFLELRTRSRFWAGDLDGAADAARAGLVLLPIGSDDWFCLASLAVTASGQRGDNDEVATLMRQVHTAAPVDVTAREHRIEALSRGLSQLTAAGRPVDDQWVTELDCIDPQDLSLGVRAWWWRRDAYQRVSRDFEAGLESYLQANRAHMEAGHAREAVQTRLLISNGYRLTGEFELAAQCLDAVEQTVRRLGTPYLGVWLDYTAGKLLTESGSWQQASKRLEAVLRRPEASVRIRFGAHIYRGIAALRHGHPDIALEHATQVSNAEVPHLLLLAASALALRAHLALQSPTPTWSPFLQTLAETSHTPMPEFDALVGLARVEGYAALGQDAEAEHIHAQTLAALARRCATMPDSTRRGCTGCGSRGLDLPGSRTCRSRRTITSKATAWFSPTAVRTSMWSATMPPTS